MSRSWLSGAVTKSGRRGGSPAPRFTPRVTQLEERDVPATFYVATGGSDFHGPRTQRAALASVDVPESVVPELEKAKARL